jgi:hypothetical protein
MSTARAHRRPPVAAQPKHPSRIIAVLNAANILGLRARPFSFPSVPFSLSPSLPSLPNEQLQPSPTSTLSQPDEEASADASPGLSTRARGITERPWQHQHIDDDCTFLDDFYRATNDLQARRPRPSTHNHQPIHPRLPSTVLSDRSFDRSPAASPGPILDHPILARLTFGSPLSLHKPRSTHPDVILPDVRAFLLLNLFSDALTRPVIEPGWGRHSRRPLAVTRCREAYPARAGPLPGAAVPFWST